MAARVAVAIRQQEALARLAEAAGNLGRRFGVEVGDLAPQHKDPDIERVLQLEALVAFLGQIEAAAGQVQTARRKDTGTPK